MPDYAAEATLYFPSMKSVQLLQICLISTCSNILFNNTHLEHIITALYSRRSYSGRHRHRRALSAPATPSPQQHQPRRSSRITEPSHRQRTVQPFVWVNMALAHRRSRGSQDAATISLDAVLAASGVDMKTDPSSSAAASATLPETTREDETKPRDTWVLSTPPPSVPRSETFETRSSRSTSSASRNTNRLSLTLPIAPPSAVSSRPTPTTSVPPTPVDTSTLNSPIDPNDFIIAIAAQERRVLELREELGRAESELKNLQKQYTLSKQYRKRPSNRNIEPTRGIAPVLAHHDENDDITAARRSTELERRKAVLLAQSQASPRDHKRTVIRGGHTRTLSLLSPTRSSSDISPHEDQDLLRSPDLYTKRTPNPATLNKRATWAPLPTPQSNGVKQIANDFKQGLWTFVEDLRQATVGDEAISGTTHRTSEMVSRLSKMDGDQDTIRASSTTRARIPFPCEPDLTADSQIQSPSGSLTDRVQHRRSTSRAEPKARKHYSWTPLTFDSFDDDDWSSWDTPTAKSSSRWSGSTMNGEYVVPAIPEKIDENDATLHKRSRGELGSPSPLTPSKLEELPQAILNRFSPTNIKNSTSNFIKEWEKSLSPTAESTTFENALQDIRNSLM
ncbi:hypothetical protein F4809DRAFT_121645 [Biscogniauxia mediterranea]|nr:hypothetical protein F4809DRAFT_121645 [Biscogniauxia mediterranea]